MTMLKFTLDPYDVLFFGRGKPFNIGSDVQSTFPPFPHTVAGAICGRIAQRKKINISKILKMVYGPFIEKREESKDVILCFPKPANIYTEKKHSKIEKLYEIKPQPKKLFKLINFEDTNRPRIEDFCMYTGEGDIEPFDGFITQEGLEKWISGKKVEKDDILSLDEVFYMENRAGIKMDFTRGNVESEDGLYRVDYIRLKNNISIAIWAEFDFENGDLIEAGLTDNDMIYSFFNEYPRVLKLGGEMRSVNYTMKADDFNLKHQKLITRVRQGDIIRIVFLTPAVCSTFPPEINGLKIKSMASNGYEIMGINSNNLDKKTVTKVLPAGTTIWAEVTDEEMAQKILSARVLEEKDGQQSINSFIGSNLIAFGRG
ncbi:MAG: type III-B CRISPR module-associated protein Cmr3 [Tepidanaerobacteraceae bacterium]|nr:type III-B CRISPR module-associated protein Cmr3 [Tepidanaerobacteraceae bacterium]